jgi:hypothetical protein
MFITSVNFSIYIFIEILLGISIITTIVLSFLGYNSIQYGIRAVTDISANWKKQPILEISTSSSSSVSCESGFTPLIEDKWPGTVEGCDCVGAWSFRIPVSNRNRLNRMTCSFNMTLGGCRGVRQLPPMSLNIWKGKNICVRKSVKTYDDYSKNAADKNKGCLSGYKQCGVLDSLGNLLCEESSKECPVNKIIVQSINKEAPKDYKYTKIELDSNMILYSTNEAVDQQIVSEIKLSEGIPCVDPGEINTKFEQYILDREYGNYICQKKINDNLFDTRFNLIDSTGKSDLYRQNGIWGVLSVLPGYPYTNLNTNVDMYSRSFIGWKSSCYRDSVLNPDIVNKLSTELDSISSYKIVIIVFSFLLLVYFIITVLIKWVSDAKNNPIVFNLIELGQCILAVVMLIMASMCVNRSGTYSTDFADFNCGDSITNESFIEIGRNFGSSVGYDKAILALSFYNSFVYVLYGLIQFIPLCVMPKKGYSQGDDHHTNFNGPLNEMPQHPHETTNNEITYPPMTPNPGQVMQGTPPLESKNLEVPYNSNYNNVPFSNNVDVPYVSHNQGMQMPQQNEAPKPEYPDFNDLNKQ